MRVALITGASRGIGFAAAQKFIDSGHAVILVGRSESSLQQAQKKLGGNSKYLVWDLRDVGSTEQKVKEAIAILSEA